MQPGPFKHDYAYSGFSETTAVTGKNWGVTIHELAKSYANFTGRDTNTGYDAAGNVVTDRVQTLPSVLNRSLKYDTAGRQVEIFDPAIHTCCEVDMTYKSYYDGDGRKVKKEDISSTTTTTTYDLRSTVLGGEKVGELIPYTNPNTKFIVPAVGGQIVRESLGGGYSVITSYSQDMPEGYGYDPRGAPVGEEPGTSLTGGGISYPGFPDASNPNRCSWAGIAMSCDMSDRLTRVDRLEAFIVANGGMMEMRAQEIRDRQKAEKEKTSSLGVLLQATIKRFNDPDNGKYADPSSLPSDGEEQGEGEGISESDDGCKNGYIYYGDDNNGNPICVKRINEKVTVKGEPEPDPVLGPNIVSNLKDIVLNIAKRPDCAERLNRLAVALSKDFGSLRNVPAGSSLVETTYNSLGKIEIDPSKVTQGGASTRDGNVYLLPYNHPTAFRNGAVQASRTLQELVHNFRKGSTYLDRQLDKAALSVMDKKDADSERDRRKSEGEKYGSGSIAHRYTSGVCRISDEEFNSGKIRGL